MAEHYRALIVILLLATFTFAYLKKSIVLITDNKTYRDWSFYWFTFTLIAFLSNNFWVFIVLAGLLMLRVSKSSNIIALYFLLLFIVPPAGDNIPGFGIINYFIDVNHLRLLTLTLLIPAFFIVKRNPGYIPVGKLFPDKILMLYLALIAALSLRDTTVTDTLRQSFYLVIDIFLPYIVISRSVKTIENFKSVFLALLASIAIMSLIGMFEFKSSWLLYTALKGALGMNDGHSYLARAGLLRASASTGQAIVLGYIVTVGIGFYLFLQRFIPNSFSKKLIVLILIGGLIAPLSRGPWLGAAFLIIVFIATGQKAFTRLTALFLAALIALPLIAALPGGEKVIDLLPFIGETEKANIEYREKLIDNSIIVIKQNLMLGSPNFLDTPEMQEMRQGQGIIDIVNSYLRVTLESGLVGLCLFSGFFLIVLKNIYRGMKVEKNKSSEYYLLGRVLVATLAGILATIVTVSSISFVPIVYWSVGALGVAYYQMMLLKKEAK